MFLTSKYRQLSMIRNCENKCIIIESTTDSHNPALDLYYYQKLIKNQTCSVSTRYSATIKSENNSILELYLVTQNTFHFTSVYLCNSFSPFCNKTPALVIQLQLYMDYEVEIISCMRYTKQNFIKQLYIQQLILLLNFSKA